MKESLLLISVILLGLSSIFFINFSAASANSELVIDKNKYSGVFVQLTGYSMYPTIKDGEMEPCEPSQNYEAGDIVAFNKGDLVVGHRIIGQVFGRYITKGDNNVIPDIFLLDKKDIICKISVS